MIQSLPITISVDQFLDWYPANSTQLRYELHNGFIKQIPPPTGDHELLIAFLIQQILQECARISKPYLIPKIGFVQSSESESAFLPDIWMPCPYSVYHSSLTELYCILSAMSG